MATSTVPENNTLTQTVTFTNSDSTTGGFGLTSFVQAQILVTAVSGGATTLTWKCREKEGGSQAYVVADATDTAKTTTVAANRAYYLPDELYPAAYVTATTDAGTVTCKIIVKA